MNTQQIWKVSKWERAYIQAYYVLEITYELGSQSGGIKCVVNEIDFAAGKGGAITL